jgi:hypothetical protein
VASIKVAASAKPEPGREKPAPIRGDTPKEERELLLPQWESHLAQLGRLMRIASPLREAAAAEPTNEQLAQALALIDAELEPRQ